jgi:Tol biopolymer transport system component
MADEQNLEEGGPEAGAEDQAPHEPETVEPAAAGAESVATGAPAPLKERGSRMGWISFLFVALAAVGVFSYGASSPSPGVLGLGLLGWGILDLFGQARGGQLKHWQGPQAGNNLLNLVRALFLLGLGSLLMLQALGVMDVFGSNTLLVACVSFLAGYLLGAYALQLSTQSGESFAHALLMGGFSLQFFSFFCFSVIFSVSWAALFGLLSLSMAAWAIFRGVLKGGPSLAPHVALVTLLLSIPFGVFLVQEVVEKDLQPVYQDSIFTPRFHELKANLSRQATDLAWSPGNTQPSHDVDIPYSDKIAFVDDRSGKKFLTVYAQNEAGGAVTEKPLDAGFGRPWWSPNSDTLAMTEVDPVTRKRVLTALKLDNDIFESGGERLFHFSPMTVSTNNVFAQDTHGQIFSPDGSSLYFAAPESKPRAGLAGIWTADMASQKAHSLTGPPYKTFPAAAPDASKLLFVGYKESVRSIQIGDGKSGEHPRYFNYLMERQLFPASNAEQTQVLYIDGAGALKIMSANNKSDAVSFGWSELRSRLWKTESGSYFTLDKNETGDLWQIWTMRPSGGRGGQMIYETGANEVSPPMWSSDSKRIAFIERSDSRYNVVTVGRDGSWPRRVFSSSDPIRDLSWSPDATRLAWFSDRHEGARQELWIAEKESLNPEMVYGSGGALGCLSWSPAGQHIAFEEKWAFKLAGFRLVRPDLYDTKILDIKNRLARSLTAGGLFARQAVFSPRGAMLAFLTEPPTFPLLPGNWSLLPAPRRPAALAVAQLY